MNKEDLHFDILDEHRKQVAQELFFLKGKGFYLADGTALALLIGHRDSIDFDFFHHGNIDVDLLYLEIEQIFANRLFCLQKESNTLTCTIDETIKVSFFGYKYKTVVPLIQVENFFPLASKLDITCMKCSAVVSRATNKDYVDLYYLLQEFTLDEVEKACEEKFETLNIVLVKKSLVYFDDIIEEPILVKPGFEKDFSVIQEFFKKLLQKS